MIATGLLWYDDDTRRPLAAKIADAAQRFRERVGYEPTTCQLNPALAQQATAQREQPKRRSRKLAEEPAPEIPVRLEPSDSLRPNYFFVGVQDGDKLKRVRGWQSPDQIEDKPGARPAKARRVSATVAAKQPAPTKAIRATQREKTPPAPAEPVAEVSAPVATAPRSRARTIPEPAAVKKAAVAVASAPVAETNAPVAATPARKASKPRPLEAPLPAPAPKISAVAPIPEQTTGAPARTRKMKNAATPATVPAPIAATTAPGAAHVTRKSARARATAASETTPAPKRPAVAPSVGDAKDTPKPARNTKNTATPATAPVSTPSAQPVFQPAPRTRRPVAATARPSVSNRSTVAVAASATPTGGASQTSLWGDMPPAAPTRKRRSA